MKDKWLDFKLPLSDQNRSNLIKLWQLDPKITFLNHGSFGACPLPVLAVQQQLRDRIERQPLQFFERDFEALLDAARLDLAALVGADPSDLAFVPNATTGVNTILRSLQFAPGDQLLTTSQVYNACRNALDFVAERSGATVVVAPVPYPIIAAEQVTTAVLQAVSPQTRLVLLDHIVSQTGFVLPIAQLVSALSRQGIDTLIDGAHAPGMVPLHLAELGATYYTGNGHKWLCSPRGAAFLYVRRDRQAQIRPLTISHGANSPRTDRSRFHLEFDWTGTTDPTPYLCIPAAIQFLQSLLPGGLPALMAHNRTQAIAARNQLCQSLSTAPPSPDNMVGALATIPLPAGSDQTLKNTLLDQFQIEVPIIPFPTEPHRLLRISAQIYNSPQQYEYLGQALKQLL
jgi:isopenicillin-N epimerase